jgi:uncharacterized protein (TIGR02186 family)
MIRWLFLLLVLALPTRAEEVVAGLSQSRVSITANFDGSEILVFGAVRRDSPPPATPPLEVVIAVTGPPQPADVRKKNRRFGIWINTEQVEIDAAPHFYAVATTGPLFEVLSHTEDLRYRISIPRGIRSVGAPPEIEDAALFTDALIRIKAAQALYRVDEGSVDLRQDTLFETRVALPANLVEGPYLVRFFLTRGRQVIDSHSTVIEVRKVGLERFLYRLAYDQPLLYGLLALLLAGGAGWGASAAFQAIRR